MSDKITLRIVTDGTPQGTRVVDQDGRVVDGVRAVKWEASYGGTAIGYVEFICHNTPDGKIDEDLQAELRAGMQAALEEMS